MVKTMKVALFVSVVGAVDPFISSTGDGSWQWNDVVGTQCMDGSQTGAYVRYSKSGNPNLGVYLYGGGACFNTITCRTASTDPHPGNPGVKGIFDSRSDNPLVDYNWIAVPYCTGDVHGGEAVSPSSFATKRIFNGAPNLRLIMDRVAKTFAGVETMFITGESAGGFGALTSYSTIRDYFPKARGVLMDDSGPVLDDTAIPPCLQEKWRQLWDLNKNLPSDCPCNNDEGNLVSAWSYATQKYPNDSFSLVSSVEDSVIGTFFAFSNNNCKAVLPVGYTKLQAGLENLAKTTPVYMIPGSGHTHTSSDEFYSRSVADVGLFNFIAQLTDANQPDPSSVYPTADDYWNENVASKVNKSIQIESIV